MRDILEILEFLPHRYPFLLIDRVLELKENQYIKAVKNVSINEPYFMGHFPGDPVMPGVLIIEAMAQAGGIMHASALSEQERKNRRMYFAGIEKARFRKVVRPGDQLIIEGKVLKQRGSLWKMEAQAYVDGELVAEALLQAFVVKVK